MGLSDIPEKNYDRELECGCLISTDVGGATLPCNNTGYTANKSEKKRCRDSWATWKKTKDYKKYLKELEDKKHVTD